MAAKAKTNPLNGMHTAGIFSDMSIDGPEIGTLVLIVDRAKNLPNRKTIGKQDPYVAARLGKEAKKTTTDVRGGQTPRWDQELRFNVHDCPDYYQLKLSVFNDDKKTDLIGETWMDLRDIIVPGGGQNDHWHTLNCKGKYAGEVRIETTFYDSRPKPEKQLTAPKAVASGIDNSGSPSPGVPGGPKPMVKRRPLPSDPNSRKQPERVESGPRKLPERVESGPRPQPQAPAPASVLPKQSSPPIIEYPQGPPQVRHAHSTGDFTAAPGPEYHYAEAQRDAPRRSYEDQSRYVQSSYNTAHIEDQRSQHGHGRSEFDPPPPLGRPARHSIGAIEQPPPPPAHRNRGGSVPSHEMAHRGSFDVSPHKSTALMMRHDVLRNEAHRHSIAASPSSSSVPYPGRPAYRLYDSAPEVPNGSQYQDLDHYHHPSPPRHHSYDSTYEAHSRPMQPTVEDVPESWTPPKARYSQSQEVHTPPNPRANHQYQRNSHYEMTYEEEHDLRMSEPNSAPPNTGGHGSAASNRYQNSPSPLAIESASHDSSDYQSMSNAIVPRGYSHASMSSSPAPEYSHDSYVPQGNELALRGRQRSADFSATSIPATLIPGFDPSMQEIADRIYDDRRRERRYTQPAPASAIPTPTRGRPHEESHTQYNSYASPHGHYHGDTRVYGRSPPVYGGEATSHSAAPVAAQRYREVSPAPNPSHTIKRKSVSPAPPPAGDRGDGRRLSGIPFGPDDYDELNPSVVSAKDATMLAHQYTNPQGKIVTNDGREVDPSDHLPEDTWAPEPEPKNPLQAEEPRARAALSGAHPMPASNYKNIRVTVRPHSMAPMPSRAMAPLAIMDRESPAPLPPTSAGRNRLQKKQQHRDSAPPAPVLSGTSPLGPASAHHHNSTPPRSLVRASTFDYENHMVPYNASQGAARTGYGNAPPIPAKIPVMSGGRGPISYEPGPPANGGDWALVQELSRIDLGSGRARRHGGY
ncbi:C2 domain-containing protein [Microdochium nivale]|nr:C2 domain-containing protein [Microdochium nivale]